MTELVSWDPNGDQVYDSPEPQEISAASFNKAPGSSFSMDSAAGTLTLLPSQKSVWGGSPDISLPPVEINISHGALVMRARPSDQDGVDFAMGPYIFKLTARPMVEFTIADATFEAVNFNVVSAGGVTPALTGVPTEVNLDLKLSGNGRYNVDCRMYLSSKMLLITDRSAMKVRAEEIVLTFSRYNISATSSLPNEDSSLNMESTRGDMTMANTAMLFETSAKGKLKSKTLIVRGMVGVAAHDNANVSFATDLVSFYDATTVAQFTISDDASITFNSNSGGLPFDFRSNAKYNEGLFNFHKASKGTFTLYGIGNESDKSGMLAKGVVSIDGEPQRDDGLVKFDFVGENMVMSLK